MNRSATSRSGCSKPSSRRLIPVGGMHERGSKTLLVRQAMLVLSVIAIATSVSAETTTYTFVAEESQFGLTGGIAGLDEKYVVEGSFELNVDFVANVASFVDVDATLTNASGILHGASLDSLLNMEAAAGTVVDMTTLAFTAVDDQGFAVSIDVGLMPGKLTLVGANVIECCDRFSYQIDAQAVPEPQTFLLSVSALIGLLLGRFRRHARDSH